MKVKHILITASKHAAEKAGGGKQGAESAASSGLFGMSLDEAKQILNVTDLKDVEKLNKVRLIMLSTNFFYNKLAMTSILFIFLS